MPDFAQTTDTVSSTHRELQEPSAHYQDQNKRNGIMTSSLHSGIGFFPPRFNQTSFPLPDKFAVIFFFGCAIFCGRNSFPPATFCTEMVRRRHHRACLPWAQTSCRTLAHVCSSKCCFLTSLYRKNTKTLEGGQTLQEPLAQVLFLL